MVVGGQLVLHGVHAEFEAHLVLRAHVGARRGIVADEHDGEARRDAARLQLGDGGAGLLVGFLGDGFAVDERGELACSDLGFRKRAAAQFLNR